jgi:hypothetical protein
VAVNEVAIYGGMLEGLERVSWLISYTSTHEYQFRTYYAENSQRAGGGQFITDLSSIYAAILGFLKSAYGYYERNKLSELFFRFLFFSFSFLKYPVLITR